MEFSQQRNDERSWEQHCTQLEAVFSTKTRDEWCAILEGTDACFAPVLTLEESFDHPHIRARQTYAEVDGIRQPTPAPRFSSTPGSIAKSIDPEILMKRWGVTPPN